MPLGIAVANADGVNNGLYSGVAAANTAERRLEAVTANLANVNASGFKRRATSVASFDTELRATLERQTAARESIDFSQGALSATGNPFDLALNGPGFFAVEGPRGELVTRDGRFRVDAEGVLQTAEGFAVAWDGPRGSLDATGEAISIDADARVWQGREQRGRLRLVDFAARERLVALGSGYFAPTRGAGETEAQARVSQGHVEQANVSAVDEMVELIAVQRSFESATRLLSMIDQSYRRLTNPN